MRAGMGFAVKAWMILWLGAGPAAAADNEVKSLIKGLRSPDLKTRVSAAMSLYELRPPAKAALAGLTLSALDRNLNVRYFAIQAVGALGADAKAAVPALIKALDTFPGGSEPLDGPERYYADVRSVAAEALEAVGPGAKKAVPALKKALQDPDPSVRSAAAAALRRIDAR